MTEKSYLWNGTADGDAIEAPYSAAQFRRIMRILFSADDTKSGIVPGVQSLMNMGLNVFAYGASSVSVYPGAAIVDGAAYVLDAYKLLSFTKPSSGTYYYIVALRCDIASQTARAVMVGPGLTGYPALTQNTSTWEIPLRGLVITSGGIQYIVPYTEDSVALNHVGMAAHTRRQGGSATNWHTAGTTDYVLGRGAKIQYGVVLWTGASEYFGTGTVTFPHAYTYAPIVFGTFAKNATGYDVNLGLQIWNISTTGFSYAWEDFSSVHYTSLKINWMAIGNRAEY